MQEKILNLTVDDLPRPKLLTDIPPSETDQWWADVDRLLQISQEATRLFLEANRRIKAALGAETSEEAAPSAEEAVA